MAQRLPFAVNDFIRARQDTPGLETYYEAAFSKRPAEELYDMDLGPSQMDNVAGRGTFDGIKRSLSARLDQRLLATADPRALGHPPTWESNPHSKQLRVWTRLLADGARRSAFPSYVLAPQSARLWGAEHLEKIKAIVAALPSVDTDRIYILGHSMGGHGTYILLQIDPGYFAAAVPSAGTGLPQTEEFIDASLIKDIPIWAFHGDKDTVCPYERAQKLFAEMGRLGGTMKLTTWAGDGHGIAAKMISGGDNGSTRCSSDRCDGEPEMLEWLFSQSLADRECIRSIALLAPPVLGRPEGRARRTSATTLLINPACRQPSPR